MKSLRVVFSSAALLIALMLACFNLSNLLPVDAWLTVLVTPDDTVISQVLVHDTLLPRMVMSLLTGAGLGLAGLIFQQVLKNPLAEPSTLGVANGAQLGMTLATLWGGQLISPYAGALYGATAMGCLVAIVIRGKRLSPVSLILVGLVMTLYCSAISQLIGLYFHERLQSVLLWGTGSLTQNGWGTVGKLLPQLLVFFLLTMLLIRPLILLGMDDSISRNLGLRLHVVRFVSLFIAICLTAALVTTSGIIGFIGLFAPLIARLLGARRLTTLVVAAPATGALLLMISDQAVILLSTFWREVPTGTVTAVLGAPALLMLLPRLREEKQIRTAGIGDTHIMTRAVSTGIAAGITILFVLIALALFVGQGSTGWQWSSHATWDFRLPRVVAALASGAMLGLAGCLIQRLTGNPVASPEVVGVSTGAAAGLVLVIMLVPGDLSGWLLPAGCLGSVITLLVVTTIAGYRNFSPQRMMLAGMALNAAFMALLMLMLAGGDPRVSTLLTWFAGSTYGISASKAWSAAAAAIALGLLTPLIRRWLTLLPLGATVARATGVPLTASRLTIMCIASVLTATSTFIVGPLSFVGLMAPHAARALGYRSATSQMCISALAGSALMVASDWIGRMLIFPFQLPAGLVAALVGVPFFLWLIRRS